MRFPVIFCDTVKGTACRILFLQKEKTEGQKTIGPAHKTIHKVIKQKLSNINYASSSSFIFAKQSLQKTSLPSVGLKGTFASPPHDAQVAMNISLAGFAAFLRAIRQSLQRWGSFWKPFSAEFLFACGENKFITAFFTCESLVFVHFFYLA